MKKNVITVIKRSCLTGRPVWIYQGPSQCAASKAYWRACKKEIERVKHWGDVASQRMANVAHILSECMASLPITAELTDRQKAAAKSLQAIGKQLAVCDHDFYDHIMEERRRRAEDREIRRKMRERQMRQNANYDK